MNTVFFDYLMNNEKGLIQQKYIIGNEFSKNSPWSNFPSNSYDEKEVLAAKRYNLALIT